MASDKATGFEPTDVEPWLLACLAGGVAAVLALTPCALLLCYPSAVGRVGPPLAWLADIPEPRLQANPSGELAAFRRAEEHRLSTYGWADRKANTVHLPIERALSLTLERGLSGWQKP